jgi:hypothetical protein
LYVAKTRNNAASQRAMNPETPKGISQTVPSGVPSGRLPSAAPPDGTRAILSLRWT